MPDVTSIRVLGQVADDAAAGTAELPVRVGAVADDAVATVTDGDKVHLVTDLYRRLRVAPDGAAAHGAAAAGNPLLCGAKANAAEPAAVDENDVANLSATLTGRLRVDAMGNVADDAANAVAELPLKMGAVAIADPTAAADVTGSDKVHLLADLKRRLWAHVVGGVADDAANVTTEHPVKIGAVADDVVAAVSDADAVHLVTDLYRRLRVCSTPQFTEASWIDSNAVSADAYYPAEAGLTCDVYTKITLTGKIITGADNTSILTIEVTNDEDATPSNRDWITIYIYDNKNDTNVNNLTSAVGTTTTFAWSMPAGLFKYVRAKYDITRPAANNDTVIIKARYES